MRRRNNSPGYKGDDQRDLPSLFGQPPLEQSKRIGLPSDLPGALKRLDDEQFDELRRAVKVEADRREKATAPCMEAPPKPTRQRMSVKALPPLNQIWCRKEEQT